MDTDAATGSKRDREQETADGDEEGAAKKLKVVADADQQAEPEHRTEGEEAQEPEAAGDAAETTVDAADTDAGEARPDEGAAAPGGNGATAEDDAMPEEQGEPEPQQPDEPRRLGYKLFNTGKDAADYYRNLVNKLTKNQDLNEYEYHNVLELLKSGHPEAERKMGPGVRAVQVRRHPEQDSECFFLMRTDGSMEDFSATKCINALFPAYGRARAASQPKRERGRGGGGRGEGRGGRRGRGRGGEGGGRRGGGRGRGRRGRR